MSIIRKIYLYLFSLVGLVLVVMGSVQIINLGLRAFVFRDADRQWEYPQAIVPQGKETPTQPSREELQQYQENQVKAQRERELANALAMIAVGAPLYWYHWKVINREKQESRS